LPQVASAAVALTIVFLRCTFGWGRIRFQNSKSARWVACSLCDDFVLARVRRGWGGKSAGGGGIGLGRMYVWTAAGKAILILSKCTQAEKTKRDESLLKAKCRAGIAGTVMDRDRIRRGDDHVRCFRQG